MHISMYAESHFLEPDSSVFLRRLEVTVKMLYFSVLLNNNDTQKRFVEEKCQFKYLPYSSPQNIFYIYHYFWNKESHVLLVREALDNTTF